MCCRSTCGPAPSCPLAQWCSTPPRKPPPPLELRVYPGADADFTLYEDENDNHNYQKGAYTTITMHWNEKTQQLTIGRRAGRYSGMAMARSFKVVFVGKGQGTGDSPAAKNARVVLYLGNPVSVGRQQGGRDNVRLLLQPLRGVVLACPEEERQHLIHQLEAIGAVGENQ